MRNFVSAGDRMTVAAPYALTPGQGARSGSIFGIAEGAAALNAQVTLKTTGVFDVPKPGSQAWTVGQPIYWDNAARLFTNVLTGNLLVGVATQAVPGGAGDTTGRVRLDGATRV